MLGRRYLHSKPRSNPLPWGIEGPANSFARPLLFLDWSYLMHLVCLGWSTNPPANLALGGSPGLAQNVEQVKLVFEHVIPNIEGKSMVGDDDHEDDLDSDGKRRVHAVSAGNRTVISS